MNNQKQKGKLDKKKKKVLKDFSESDLRELIREELQAMLASFTVVPSAIPASGPAQAIPASGPMQAIPASFTVVPSAIPASGPAQAIPASFTIIPSAIPTTTITPPQAAPSGYSISPSGINIGAKPGIIGRDD